MINPVNFFVSTLRAPITTSDTQLLLAAGAGTALSGIGAGNYAYVTVNDGMNVEVMRYTSTGPITNESITVVRALDNTSAKAFPTGACVKIVWNILQLDEYIQRIISETPTPANTVTIGPSTVEPTSAPPTGVIYAIKGDTGQMWYWNGVAWFVINSNRVQYMTDIPTVEPPVGTIWTIVKPANLLTHLLYWWDGLVWQFIAGERNTVYFTSGEGVYPAADPPVGITYALNTVSGQLFYWSGAWIPIRTQEYNELQLREWNDVTGITLISPSDNSFGDLVLTAVIVPTDTHWQSNEALDPIISIQPLTENILFTPPTSPPPPSPEWTGQAIGVITATMYGEIVDGTKPFRARLVVFRSGSTFQYSSDATVEANNLTPQVGLTVTTGPMLIAAGEQWAASIIITRDDGGGATTYSGLQLFQFCLCASVISRSVPLA